MRVEPHTGLLIGLHHHNANQGEKFEESHTGIRRRPNGPYSTVVFRDPATTSSNLRPRHLPMGILRPGWTPFAISDSTCEFCREGHPVDADARGRSPGPAVVLIRTARLLRAPHRGRR